MSHRRLLRVAVSFLVAFVLSVVCFGKTARAEQRLPVYAEAFTGVRTIRPDNIALKVRSDAPSQIRIDAREVSPGVAGVFGGGGGLVLGPLVLGGELSLGIGGNA